MRWVVYTDGSYCNAKPDEVHGGIVFWSGDPKTSECVHVWVSNENFTSMNNVGGEILAAWAAIMSVVAKVQKLGEADLTIHELELRYDYQGVGEWLKGGWKAKKPATQWFVRSVRAMLEKVPNLKIKYTWMRGHEQEPGNELADSVAMYDMGYCKRVNVPIACLDEIVKEHGGG